MPMTQLIIVCADAPTLNVLILEECCFLYLQPRVVCSRVVMPTQKKMVPMS